MISAPLWRRALATLIDFVSVPAVSFGIMLVSGAMASAEAYAGIQPYVRPVLLGIAGYLLLNGWLLYARGQTVGKALLGIHIVDVNSGNTPALSKLIFIRALFFPLLYLPFGYSFIGLLAVLPLFDLAFGLRGDRRCLHDFAAGTAVRQRNRE